MAAFVGTSLQDLDYALTEHFNPGAAVELLLGLPHELSDAEVQAVRAYLASRGFEARVDVGSTAEWPSALRVTFTRPSRSGVAALPLAVLIIGALGVVGVLGILGWRLGAVFDALAKQIVPIALIAVGGFILYGYATRGRK